MSQDNKFGLREWLADQVWMAAIHYNPHPHSNRFQTIFKGAYSNHDCTIKGCVTVSPTTTAIDYYYHYLMTRPWEERV